MITKKRVVAITIPVILILSFAVIASAEPMARLVGKNAKETISFPSVGKIENTAFPNVVAQVGGQNITGLELTREIAIQKTIWEKNLKKQQSNNFYEEMALGHLVENALLDNEAKLKGITASKQEAQAYLKEEAVTIQQDQNPSQFLNYINAQGYHSLDSYFNSPSVISATQQLLTQSKLLQQVCASPSDKDIYINSLLSDTSKYKIDIPVGIKGYISLEKNTLPIHAKMTVKVTNQ